MASYLRYLFPNRVINHLKSIAMKRTLNKNFIPTDKTLEREKPDTRNKLKKTMTILLLAIATFISSCEGPMGPPGPPGLDGDTFLGTVFEIQGDFTPENDYSLLFEFPNDFTVYDSDVVLVYILWEVTNDGLDIWRLLPQTVVLKDGQTGETDVLQYNFDYTLFDVQVFLEGTFDLAYLYEDEWKNQVFRIAVLPAEFAHKEGVDIMEFGSILKSPEISLKMMDKVDLNNVIVK